MECLDLKPCPLPRCGHPAKYHEKWDKVSCSYCSTFWHYMSVEDWQSLPREKESTLMNFLATLGRIVTQWQFSHRWFQYDKPNRTKTGFAGSDGLYAQERSEADKERLK